MRTTVRTVTGKSLDLINPDPAQICIEDIAHQLAQLNRYNGACPFPYSVGQHSLLVAAILPPRLQLWGLLHDAAEVYLGDLVSPAKRIPALGQVFKPLEHRIQAAICVRFGLDPAQDYAPIKEADDAVMAVEMAHLNGWPDLVAVDRLPRPGHIAIQEMHWRHVEGEFLAKFNALIARKAA
ncbi:MAG: hypothetical protein JEY71_10405 [Sphaerochaeta sp.]|nr:hypothetical protein [Sphaerochaeta sp.]